MGPQKSKSKVRSLPYAFTEQGVAMISTIIRTEVAIEISIRIMDAFIEMRKFIALNGQVVKEIDTIKSKIKEYDYKFEQIFNQLQKTEKELPKQQIFYDGQIYDAYSLIVDIIKKANERIVIIDNYIDDSVLKMLSKKKKNVKVVILTSMSCYISKLDIEKFNKQYPLLKILRSKKFHDRFIIIDNKELYHCGASIKDLGNKCFAINKMEDVKFIENIEKIV